jgi:hypothetical protein
MASNELSMLANGGAATSRNSGKIVWPRRFTGKTRPDSFALSNRFAQLPGMQA